MRRLSLVLLVICAFGTPALSQAAVDPVRNDTSAAAADLSLALRGPLAIIAKQWLLYVTGGDIGDTRLSAADACTSAPCSTLSVATAEQSSLSGWALGAGLEGVLSGPWTARVEYLRYDVGSRAVTGLASGSRYGWTLDAEGQLVRAGLNFTFGGIN